MSVSQDNHLNEEWATAACCESNDKICATFATLVERLGLLETPLFLISSAGQLVYTSPGGRSLFCQDVIRRDEANRIRLLDGEQNEAFQIVLEKLQVASPAHRGFLCNPDGDTVATLGCRSCPERT